MIYLQLFWEFFKTGLFSIGGGLATLPFLYDMGEKTGWFTAATVADVLAISESTPGPIGINMATYVGFTCAGVPGAALATLGLITPSIIVILVIASFLRNFQENRYVRRAFYGLRPASLALISAAGASVLAIALLDLSQLDTGSVWRLLRLEAIALAALLYVLTNHVKRVKNWHPIVFIAVSAAVGIVFRFGGA